MSYHTIAVRDFLTRLHHSLYATACGFGWPPWLGTTHTLCEPSRDLVGASSARVCYHTNPPSAYTSVRAIRVVVYQEKYDLSQKL